MTKTPGLRNSAGIFSPTKSDLVQSMAIAAQAGTGATILPSDSNTPVSSDNDLSVLGGDANENQQAFRQRFGLSNPTQEQLARWSEYDARLTAYSNKDADWPYPTAASANWIGTTSTNGDPLAVEGTTVAVDFNRIPRGSLVYIPALDMYAEANDTGLRHVVTSRCRPERLRRKRGRQGRCLQSGWRQVVEPGRKELSEPGRKR